MEERPQISPEGRRAVLAGLTQILDARSLEELFGGPDDEAAFFYDLLEEVAKGRAASCYWEICRTARRRQLTPEFVSDRAAVLLSSIQERRKWDLYRVLGVPPLSPLDAIHDRYLQLAKQEHPDVGGDVARFRRVKEAYDVLKDANQRAEYERFWARALGPFERVVPGALPPAAPIAPLLPRVERPPAAELPPADPIAADSTTAPATSTEVTIEAAVDQAHAAPQEDDLLGLRRVAALLGEWDRRAYGDAAPAEPGALLAALGSLRQVSLVVETPRIDRHQTELAAAITRMERVRADLATLARLKHALGA